MPKSHTEFPYDISNVTVKGCDSLGKTFVFDANGDVIPTAHVELVVDGVTNRSTVHITIPMPDTDIEMELVPKEKLEECREQLDRARVDRDQLYHRLHNLDGVDGQTTE